MRGRPRDRAVPGGFTLVELLVVLLIILLVSAATLPTVISAYNHREVGEAARILQAGLAGARDLAINTNAPAGIRLLPDPSLKTVTAAGQLEPRAILASNRFVPIQLAPDYSEGLVSVIPVTPVYNVDPSTFTYPESKGGGIYPATSRAMLYLAQEPANPATGLINPPTSWYWNVRIGDKVQINNTGIWYTVIGPMNIENPEGFVNAGEPGSPLPIQRADQNGNVRGAEVLFLVNGQDDNNDGYIDNGMDGIDNNGDGIADNLVEWLETESWQESIQVGVAVNVPYTIVRRPVVAPGARETYLPAGAVVDLTYAEGFPSERSRLPVDPVTGNVDILLDPAGRVVPTFAYSSPTSFGMDAAFYHFWIAERSDLYPINVDASGNTVPLYSSTNPPIRFLLPMPYGAAVDGTPNGYDQLVASNPSLPVLKGEIRLITLFTRTGNIITTEAPSFDITNVNQPYLQPQRGARGGQ